MKKHLLFIPFLALLGTSCSGGAITTTPVVKNAPSAVLSRQTPKSLATPNYTKVIDLGDLTWARTTASGIGFYYFVAYLDETNPIEYGTPFLSDVYNSLGWQYLNALQDGDLCMQPNTNRLFIRDDSYSGGVAFKNSLEGYHFYYQVQSNSNAYYEAYEDGNEAGYSSGYEEGFENGYIYGAEEGEAYNNYIIQNGEYAGLTAFPRRHFLETLARRVVSGLETLQTGHFDLIDTNANYTIYIKWSYSYPKTTFQDYGNTIIGELDWSKIISRDWSTSWFGKYDPELHQIVSSPKYYATDEPIRTSFYPEVYLGSTIEGDVNYYFMGTANDYQLGFADGQTYTIQASETYNNVFTIFTPAFKAVANFFNLNIGPFKIWYFFAIPLIVSLLILVLRLVKH